jgi:hypothetical protein
VHFVDGASGGYAFAAVNLKRNISRDFGMQGTINCTCPGLPVSPAGPSAASV